MMELREITIDEIHRLVSFVPGDISVYQIRQDSYKRLYYSPGIPSLLGMEKEDYRDFPLNETGEVERFQEALQKSRETGGEIIFTSRLRSGKGAVRTIHMRGRLLGTLEGYPVLLASLSMLPVRTGDMMEEKHFHQALQEVFDANPQALCMFRLNLTRDICSEGTGSSPYIRRVLQADTATELFENILQCVPD